MLSKGRMASGAQNSANSSSCRAGRADFATPYCSSAKVMSLLGSQAHSHRKTVDHCGLARYRLRRLHRSWLGSLEEDALVVLAGLGDIIAGIRQSGPHSGPYEIWCVLEERKPTERIALVCAPPLVLLRWLHVGFTEAGSDQWLHAGFIPARRDGFQGTHHGESVIGTSPKRQRGSNGGGLIARRGG